MKQGNSQPRVFYGWWIVLAAAFTLMATGGIGYYTFPVFLKPLANEFGWSRAALSGPIGLATLSAGVWLPIIGRLLDRYGPRRVMVPGALVMGVCNMLLGWMTQLWHLYVIFLVITPAMVAVTALPAQTVISLWFVKKRGLAMGLTMVGIGLGGTIFPTVSHVLIANLGWRAAYLALGLTIVVLVTPVVALVMRHKPADMGLDPDGVVTGGHLGPAAEGTRHPPHLSGLATKAALRTTAFWLLAAVFLVISIGGSYIILHLIAFATDVGIPAGSAATALSLLAGVSILGRLGFGTLGDRLNKRTVIAFCFLLHAIGLALLLQVKTTGLLYLFAALYGFAMGGTVVVIPLLIADCFGVLSFAAISGLLGVFLTLGGALGPVLAGRIFDVQGSYSLAYLIALVGFLVATLATWFVRSPPRGEPWPAPAPPVPSTPAGP